MTADDREARIRERAHRIWESEGRPEDRSAVHWDIASRIIDEEDAAEGDPDREEKLDEAVADTFPASDPTVMQEPTQAIVKDKRAVRRRRTP